MTCEKGFVVKGRACGFAERIKYKGFIYLILACIAVTVVFSSRPVYAAGNSSADSPYIVYGSELDGMLSNPRYTEIRKISVEKYRDYVRLGVSCEGNTNDVFVSFTPKSGLLADDYMYIVMLVRSNRPDSCFKLYLDAGGQGGFSENSTALSYYTGVGAWQILFFDLSDNELWRNEIHKIRLDYIEGVSMANKDYTDIAGISLCRNSDDLYDAVGKMTEYLLLPLQTYNSFCEENRTAFEKNINSTQVMFENNNLKLVQSLTDYTNDPFAGIEYGELCKSFGYGRLKATDVSVVTVRFRACERIETDNRIFELFYWVGEMSGPTGGYSKKCAYSNNSEWQSVCFPLTDATGWQGDIGGFRLDWCSGAYRGTYVEISDILIFSRAEHAQLYSEIINSVDFSDIRAGELPPQKEETTTSHDISTPGKSTDDTETFEGIPEYPTEGESLLKTEETSDYESTGFEDTSDMDTESEENMPSETNKETESETEINKDDEGSNLPFYIMCGFLVCISVTSVVSVQVIRAKNK